ncbi:unnamed protein product [Durusdinium trenchii]|uniref:Uncharacterized protein n=1 Tax=Durusdinium trenchii TaxID=1381693 RepID=A0ABP0PIC3_9DINO
MMRIRWAFLVLGSLAQQLPPGAGVADVAHTPWWILAGVTPEGPSIDMGTYKMSSFSKSQQEQFGVNERRGLKTHFSWGLAAVGMVILQQNCSMKTTDSLSCRESFIVTRSFPVPEEYLGGKRGCLHACIQGESTRELPFKAHDPRFIGLNCPWALKRRACCTHAVLQITFGQ